MNENNTLLTGKYHAYMLISCHYEHFTSREKTIERAMPILTDEIENCFQVFPLLLTHYTGIRSLLFPAFRCI